MIKNILYSLFLHSLLLALIYVNFRSNINNEITELKEGISISLADFDNKKPQKTEIATKKTEKIKKKPEIKKIVAKKRPIIKKTVKKTAPAPKIVEAKREEFKLEEEVKKEIIEEKKPIEEKIEEKPEERPEIKEEIAQETPDPEPVAAEVEDNSSEDISDNLESLNLSAREKFNIQTQLKGCYRRTLENKGENKIMVTVKVTVLKDGTLDFDPEQIIDVARYNNPKEINYRNMMDDIVKTLELCSPLRNMPEDKYEIWKEFTIEFGNNN